MQIQNRNLLINAVAGILQTILIGFAYFFLYRFILNVLGPEKLGLWSLLIASTSIGNLANLGITGSIVKFVSAANARQDHKGINEIIYTSLFSIAFLMSCISLLLYVVLYFNIEHIVPHQYVEESKAILPFALLSLVINSISAVFLSALDGLELIYLRSIIYSITTILFLIACFILLPLYQLQGLVYAQFIQAFCMLVTSFSIITMKFRKINLFKPRASKKTFKELFRYGMNFQIMTIASMLFDPISKYLLSTFSGFVFVAYFEMAGRLIMQVRGLLISANQAVVPLIARKNETGDGNISSYYTNTFKAMTLNSVIIFSLMIIYAPLISILWIGSYMGIFVYALITLSIGWFFNLVSGPAYFINMGTGHLKWNVYSHLLLGVLNLALGALIGKFVGGDYIVVTISVSLILASLLTIVKYHQENGIMFQSLLSKEEIVFIGGAIACVVVSLLAYYYFSLKVNIIYFYISLTLLLGIVALLGILKTPALKVFYLHASKLLFRLKTKAA